MAPLAIVEGLDVVEDGVDLLEACLLPLAVRQFDLHRRPERLHHHIVKLVANRAEARHEARVTNTLGEPPGCELNSVVRVDDLCAPGPALPDGHVEGGDYKVGVLGRVHRPVDDVSTARVPHSAAVDLALAGVPGGVGHPVFFELTALELALNELIGRGRALGALDLGRPQKRRNLSVVREDRHQVSANQEPAAPGELGVHSAGASFGARVGVNLSEEGRQPLAAHLG